MEEWKRGIGAQWVVFGGVSDIRAQRIRRDHVHHVANSTCLGVACCAGGVDEYTQITDRSLGWDQASGRVLLQVSCGNQLYRADGNAIK